MKKVTLCYSSIPIIICNNHFMMFNYTLGNFVSYHLLGDVVIIIKKCSIEHTLISMVSIIASTPDAMLF